MKFKIYILINLFVFNIRIFAQDNQGVYIEPGVDFKSGMVPLEYGLPPASDLYLNGRPLLPEDAHQMVVGRSFDLSTIDPDSTTVLWRNLNPMPLQESFDSMEFNPEDESVYEDTVPTRSGRFRFTISQTDETGNRKTFIVWAAKEAHNILLRKNLLRKLGYNVPPVKWMSKLKLKFSNPVEKDVFFRDLSDATFGDPSRWIPDYRDHLNAIDRLEREEFRENYRTFQGKNLNQIINLGSGLCLGRNPKKSGSSIDETECGNFSVTNWFLEKTPEGDFTIISPMTGKCLDIIGGSENKKSRVIENDCNKKDNQRFTLKTVGENFQIKIKHSGMCLAVRGGVIRKNSIVQLPCEDQDDFLWKKEEGVLGDGPKLHETSIEIQDVLVMDSSDHFYNLSVGFIPSDLISGRRLLNSLLVPYSLVNVPESVNLYNWNAGRIINKQLKLEYDSAENFTTPYEDARWIMRRILKLSREDWEEVVEKSYFPPEVSALLVEKIIARRNHLRELLNLDSHDLPFDPNISMGELLKKGKLLAQNWPGHAARYSFGDPESPLSGSEIGHFIGSTVISQALENAIGYISSHYLNNQRWLNSALQERMGKLFFDQFENYLNTGVISNIPLGIWAYPTVNGHLILSRDVVIGSYLGTDNKIQLADVLGFTVALGAYARVEGLPSPWSVSGQAQVSYTRTYSHLRPVISFKASFKYPFRNILVPYLKRKQARIFTEMLSGKIEDLKEEERQKLISENMAIFKKGLGVGESLIISDYLSFGGGVSGGLSPHRLVQISGSIAGNHLNIFRLHIYRSDENTIQVYKDMGDVSSLILTFQFRPVMPILNAAVKLSKGLAKTKFYSLNINPDLKKNPDILKSIRSLESLFRNNSIEFMNSYQKPFVLTNHFNEALVQIGLGPYKMSKVSDKTDIQIVHPEGAKKDLFLSTAAFRRGLDIESFAFDAINGVLDSFTDIGLNAGSPSNGAPGDSIGGSSVLYSVTVEGEVEGRVKEHLRKKGSFITPFGSILKSFRGFAISQKKADEILRRINEEYGQILFPELSLKQTKKIFLYDISVETYVYEEGIQHLLSLSPEEFQSLIETHKKGKFHPLRMAIMRANFTTLKKDVEKDEYQKIAKELRKILDRSNRWLTREGFEALYGGKNNFFVIGRLNGFRDSDEGGDTPILSNSIGQFASPNYMGPIRGIISKIGISPGEFYGYWVRSRLN